MPVGEENPYAVRVVSDILESNGSSSMATVCAGTLALMDCGVKIKKPVAGIAMGLISDEKTGKFVVLSDILGDEDHLGHIMGEMLKTISEPRADYRPNVPRIVQITIPSEFIGAVIGTGGKVIQEIQKTTGTTITITEEGDKGIIDIFGENKESMDAALARIKAITTVPEVGETYHGKVVSILEFGAFVEILPGKEGLLHISELDYKKVDKVEDVLQVGDEVDVKLLEIDQKTGKMRLSRRALLPAPEGWVEHERKPRLNGASNGGGRGGRDRGGDRGRGPRRDGDKGGRR